LPKEQIEKLVPVQDLWLDVPAQVLAQLPGDCLYELPAPLPVSVGFTEDGETQVFSAGFGGEFPCLFWIKWIWLHVRVIAEDVWVLDLCVENGAVATEDGFKDCLLVDGVIHRLPNARILKNSLVAQADG